MTFTSLYPKWQAGTGSRLTLLGTLASLSLTPAYATDLDLELGVAALYETTAIKGEDPRLVPLPYFELEYGNISLDFSELTYSLPLSYVRSLDMALGYRQSPFDPSDNLPLAQLDQRETAIELTLALSEVSPIGTLSGFVTSDISGVHQGFEAGLEYSLKLPLNGGALTPALGIRYLSQNQVDYYYGIEPDEAGQSLPEYQANASVNIDLQLTYLYPLSPHWSAVSALEWTRQGEGQSKSPISRANSTARTFVAVIYSF